MADQAWDPLGRHSVAYRESAHAPAALVCIRDPPQCDPIGLARTRSAPPWILSRTRVGLSISCSWASTIDMFASCDQAPLRRIKAKHLSVGLSRPGCIEALVVWGLYVLWLRVPKLARSRTVSKSGDRGHVCSSTVSKMGAHERKDCGFMGKSESVFMFRRRARRRAARRRQRD